MNTRLLFAGLALTITMTVACSKSPAPEERSSSSSSGTPTSPSTPVSTNKNDYPVFPDADAGAGADPSVSAEQGGKGFKGEGWETNTDFDLIGDPHAIKGGVFRDYMLDFPSTLRSEGPEANTLFNVEIPGMSYEGLVGLHPTTLDYIPSLATHWKISPDKMTFWFRINPNARFSDGVPVTSEDVVATFDFMMDKTLQSPSNQQAYGRLERPVAESKYIVRVHAKELTWRNFLIFTEMTILPAHILKTINGDKYIKEWNYKMLPGSGPYIVQEADVIKGKSLTVRRRKDYWGEKARANVGMGNFDELRFTVVRDESLAFEMFKKGELDFYGVNRARQWAEDLNFDSVQRGLIQKRRVYNNNPKGIQGFAMNIRRPPLDDLRVRKALTLLLDRRKLIEKIMFNAYEPQNSYFAETAYENPNNPKNEFDPQQALKLLADAGWNSRNSQGRLVKNGQPLELELLYDSKTWEPHLTVYQQDLQKVGIALNLRLITPEQLFQMMNERQFQMSLMSWTGDLFPNPEAMWSSTLADQNNSTNITGFKDKRVDEILKAYDTMFDIHDRERALREIDGILANSYQYVLHWDAPYLIPRFVYWNKFRMPQGTVTRVGYYFGMHQMWWVDPQKEAKLQQALRDPAMKLEIDPLDDRYWPEYDKKEQPPTNKTP